jgi:predicted Holliday junction resolvase-like endonuclease
MDVFWLRVSGEVCGMAGGCLKMKIIILMLVLLSGFILLSGMCCDDEHLRSSIVRTEEALKHERKRAVLAESERRKAELDFRKEREELKNKVRAESARRQWSDNYAMIICVGICICLLYIWSAKK